MLPIFLASTIAGTWVTDCTPLIRRHSVISKLELSELELKANHYLFADRECSEPNLKMEYLGQYRRYGKKFVWKLSKVDLTLLRPEVVDHYNRNVLCGFNDWQLNTPKNIEGRFCDPNPTPSAKVAYKDQTQLTIKTLSFSFFPEMPRNPSVPSTVLPNPLLYKRTN